MRKVPVFAASLLIVGAWNGIALAGGTPDSAASAPQRFTALQRTDGQALMPEEMPSFTSLQRVDAQPLSQDQMQQIAGLGGKVGIDPSIILSDNFTALAERLDPATKARLTGLLASAQARSLPIPPALSAVLGGTLRLPGTDVQGTQAQGIEQE